MIIESMLLMVSADSKNPHNPKFLLKDYCVPSKHDSCFTDIAFRIPGKIVTEKQSTFEVASYLLNEITGLKPRVMNSGWVELRQAPIADSVERIQEIVYDDDEVRPAIAKKERVISVPYVTLVPSEMIQTKSSDYRWVSLSELVEKNSSNLVIEDHFDIICVCGLNV